MCYPVNPTNKDNNLKKMKVLSKKSSDVLEEAKNVILQELFKTQNMNMEESEKLLKLETNRKNKSNIRIGNIALYQIMNNIKSKENTILNELAYATAIAVIKKCDTKRKANRITMETKNSERNKNF